MPINPIIYDFSAGDVLPHLPPLDQHTDVIQIKGLLNKYFTSFRYSPIGGMQPTCVANINPFKLNVISHCYQLEQSISVLRSGCVVFITFI